MISRALRGAPRFIWPRVDGTSRRFGATSRRHDKAGVLLKTDNGYRIRARRLVCAADYETAQYLGQKTGHLSSAWAFVSEPVPSFAPWPDRCVMWETARPSLYLRTTDDHRVWRVAKTSRS